MKWFIRFLNIQNYHSYVGGKRLSWFVILRSILNVHFNIEKCKNIVRYLNFCEKNKNVNFTLTTAMITKCKDNYKLNCHTLCWL